MAELTDAQKVLRNDTGKRIAAAIEALGGTPPIDLGMTGASVGQVPVINTVDANGAPTSYRPGAGGGGTADALPLAGGTMEGDIDMDGNAVTGLPTPTANSDAVPKSYADNIVSVSDSQPTAVENKLWVDTDAGTGSTYQVPTVAEMEAADAANAANISALQNRFPSTLCYDFNAFETVYQPMMFKLGQNSQNAPDNGAYVCLQHASSANYAVQLAFKTGATTIYMRAKTAGTWRDWKSLTLS